MMSADGLAGAGDFAQTLLVNDLGERLGKGAQAPGGARIGSVAIGIAAAQGGPLLQFAQHLDSLRGVDRRHDEEQTPKLPNGSAALAGRNAYAAGIVQSLDPYRGDAHGCKTTCRTSTGSDMGTNTSTHNPSGKKD